MNKYSKEDVMRLVEEEGVEFIRLQFTDVFGVLKNLAITPQHLERALNNRVMFDGSAIEGFVGIEESDLYLHPDPSTFTIFPWRPKSGKVARLLCSIHYPDGRAFEADPRQILKRVLKDSAQMGYRFLVGPECEFFLFHLDDNGLPTTLTHEKAGYFDVAPSDLGEDTRRDIILTMEQMGYDIEASHHEFAPAQHEIDLHYADPLSCADTIMTFRLAARTLAKHHGLYATFMPKPLDGAHGSGMHVHISLMKDGMNIMEDPEDPKGLSKEAYWFIGGVMAHMKAMTAIFNPIVNSYKRLMSGYEAPRDIAWSEVNRSILLRVPAVRGFNTRVELRSPDGAANPYLTLALVLAAGMDGVKNHIAPPDSVNENIASFSAQEKADRGIESLPENLQEALECFRTDPLIREVLGEHLMEKFITKKQEEWNEYALKVSQWEIDTYLSRF